MNKLSKRRIGFFWRYLLGHTPWDSGIVPPEVVMWIESIEDEGIPSGRALDLGCGTGTTSIYLAHHGWDVVGIDFAPNAIWQARRKARQHGVARRTTFYSADVSQLDFLPADPLFDLAIDIGCLHSLAPEQRAGYAAHLARLTCPGAIFLLYAHLPHRQGGIDADGVEALLASSFELLGYTLGQETIRPVPSGWYTLRRTGIP